MKISICAFLYIMLSSFSFYVSEVRETTAFYIQVILGILWVFLSFVFEIIVHQKMHIKKKLIKLFFVYLIPQIILHMWGPYVGLKKDMPYFEITTNLSIYFPIIMAFAAVIFFGGEAVNYTLISFCIGIFIKSVNQIISQGIGEWYVVFQPTMEADFPLEFSDPILCLGYFFIYLYYVKNIPKRKKYFILMFLVIFFVFGRKRIVLISTGLALIWGVIVNKILKTKRLKELACYITNVSLCLIAYIYIYILSLGDTFYSYIAKIGINLSGRDYFYKVMADWYTFSPSFSGIGKNMTFLLMQNEYSYFGIKAIHNDMLKIYMENGFVLFGLWLIFYYIILPLILKKNFGYKTMVLSVMLNICMFILYFSDNTDTYYGCRLLLTMLPVCYACMNESKSKMSSLNKSIGN